MPVPLIWLGAGLAAAFAGKAVIEHEKKNAKHVGHYPGEGEGSVKPVNGAIVCCGIFSVFDHTGIWLDNSIIELKGNGLIRGISPERFITDRSGDVIYIACDEDHQPLVDTMSAERAASQLYQYEEYDVLKNNCHRFAWKCISGENRPLTRFTELNEALSRYFNCKVSWIPIKLD